MADIEIHASLPQVVIHDQVRAGCEWMTITTSLRPHICHHTDLVSRIGLALAITSSFGCYGYEWPDIGEVAAQKATRKSKAVNFLSAQSEQDLLSRILQDDTPVVDFEASCTAFRRRASECLEAQDPFGDEAQSLREAILESEQIIEEMDEAYCDEHKLAVLTSSSAFWRIFPEGSEEVFQAGPSRRRRAAEAFFRQLWTPYMRSLSEPAAVAATGPI